MEVVVSKQHRLETDAKTLQFYAPPPRPDLHKTKKLPVRRFKRKFKAGKGFTIGGRVLGPIWDLYVPAVKTDPTLAPKAPTECDMAIKALKKLLREAGIPAGTPGITYSEEIRDILQKRYDVYRERVVRQKIQAPYDTSTKRIRLMQKYCAERLTLMYERALLEEDFDSALLAIELGAPANWMTRRGDTPLTITIKSNKYTYIKPFADASVPVDRRDASGWTPLCIAIQQKQLEVAQLLLQLGADPSKESVINHATKETVTPLMVAVCNPSMNVDLVYLLLRNGARVNQPSSIGRTALMFACRWRQIANARILLEEYANPAMIDNAGYTATEWVKYAARERMVEARRDKKSHHERLHSAATSTTDVVDKITLLFGGKPKRNESHLVLQDDDIALNILEQELIDEMAAKMKQRTTSTGTSRDRFGIVDIPAANSREGAALELLKRGYSVFDVVAKWKEAIGGDGATVDDIKRVLAQRVSEHRAATHKQLVNQSAAAAFIGNAVAARSRRDEAKAGEDMAAMEQSTKGASSDAVLERYGIDSIIPEQNEWTTDPRSGGPVQRLKPNTWLGYDLDSRSFQMKPSQSMLVLAAHPSALIRNVTKRILRMRAAEVVAQREEAAMKHFELSTGRSRAEIKTRGRTQRLSDSKAVLGRIDAQLSAQVAFGNYLTGYEGATKALMMSDIPDADDPDEQAVLVLTQDQLCANCQKRAARLRNLNNNKRLCEKCTLWMSQQPGLQHHRFKPIPPPGMNDGIMAKRQQHKAKEAQAMKRVSSIVESSLTRMRQTFQRVKRDLGSGKHLLPPLDVDPVGVEADAFKSATSTPRSVTSAHSSLTGIGTAPASPRQNVLKRLKQIANADSQTARRHSNVGDHPQLAAATTKRMREEFAQMEATKAARSSAVAAAAAHLLHSDPEYPAGEIVRAAESKEPSNTALDLEMISSLGRLPQRIETFEERHARIDSRPGSSRWEAGVRGLIGQAARERALRNEKKVQLFKQAQMGDFKALEKLKVLVDKSSAISFGMPRSVSHEESQRMADFAMLRQRPQTSAVDKTGAPCEKSLQAYALNGEIQQRPSTSAVDTQTGSSSGSLSNSPRATVSRIFESFKPGQVLNGSQSEANSKEAEMAVSKGQTQHSAASQRAELEAQKRQRLLQKKRERLQRMSEDLETMQISAESNDPHAEHAITHHAKRLIRLAQSLENGHGIPAETADEKKANIIRRAAVMQGQSLSPSNQSTNPTGIDSAAVVGRQRVISEAARSLGNLGFGAPGAGAHANSYFGHNLETEFNLAPGPSGQEASSALDRVTSVNAARRSMGGAVRNLKVETKIKEADAVQQQKHSKMQDDARRATAKLRVQALYTRPSEISLAYVLMEQNKLDDARRVLTDLLAKQKVTLSDMHIGFVATLVALGRLYVQTGRFEGALQHLLQAQYLLTLHQVHPGNEDSFLAIFWLSAAYTGLKKGVEENTAVESYVSSLSAAYEDAKQWQRRKEAGAVHASEQYKNYNGQLFTDTQKSQLWKRLVPVLNTSRQHRELQDMVAEDTRRRAHTQVAAARRARRQVRAKLAVSLETNWKIQQRWLYNRYFDDILYKQFPEVDPLTSVDAIEPARQKDEHDALQDLSARPDFYGAHADTDGHSDSSDNETRRPGAAGHTQALKMTDCANNLKAALSYSRWQQMLEKIAERDGIQYSVKFLAAVVKYKSANYNRVNFGGDFERQRQIEIIRSNQAARIADLYIKHPQTLPIVPMNMRERILAAQHVSPLPFDVFEDAFTVVWEQVRNAIWKPFLKHALGERFSRERLLSLILPTWSMSMVAKLASVDVDSPATAIAKLVRGVQTRRKVARQLHKRYRQLLSRDERVPAAEQFLEKWMRNFGMSALEMAAEEADSSSAQHGGGAAAPEYWEYQDAEGLDDALLHTHEQEGEESAGEGHGVDEHGFPWQYDVDGYVTFADKDGLQFYRDEHSHCYFFDEDSQQIFFEPIPPPASELEHMFAEHDHGHARQDDLNAEKSKRALSDIAEAHTISEQPSTISELSMPHAVEVVGVIPVPEPKRAAPRKRRIFRTKAEAGRVIERIGRGFLGRTIARQQLVRVFRCEYNAETDRFVYIDTRSGSQSETPPAFLTADFPVTRRQGEHPLTATNYSNRKPLTADMSDQAAKQAAAIPRRVQAQQPAAASVTAQTETPEYFYSAEVQSIGSGYPGLGGLGADSKTDDSAAALEALGDGTAWGFDTLARYPWMLDEYGARRFTDGASLTFYRDEHGAPFYYDEEGTASFCSESDLVPPSDFQVRSFFERGDGSLQV